jgi:uncharacterized protein with PIN domain
MNRTLHSAAHVKNAVLGTQVAATKTGDAIDRFNYRDAILHALVANVTGAPTAQELTIKIQHSDTDVAGDFVDAAIQNIPSTLTVTGEGELHVNLDGFKQYVRVVASLNFTGGTSPKADVIVTAVLGNMYSNPERVVK